MIDFKNKSGRVAGIGSALIDVLARVSDDFLNSVSSIKGGMTLVENTFIDDVASRLPERPEIVPGGAACNTIIGIGMLGGESTFVGQCGKDEFGKLFTDGLVRSRVTPRLFTSDSPTGRVLSLITPDAQRSMFTHLGASAEMSPNSITPELFDNASVVMVEGYLLFNRDLMVAALDAVKKAGAAIALDLASFTVVEASKDFLLDKVMDYVDILIANEDEAKAFTGLDNEAESLSILASYADIAVLKIGKRGSMISSGGVVTMIEPVKGRDAVDTTGAGDLWAAGFLFGLTHGYDMKQTGAIASACGYEVCQVTGASIPEDGWDRIRRLL